MMAHAHGMGNADEVPEELLWNIVLAIVLVTGSRDAEEIPAPYAIELAVGDPVGLDEPPQLDKQIAGEGLIAVDSFRLADELK